MDNNQIINALIQKTNWDKVDRNATMFDNVICTNCGYDGLVNLGADKCPNCEEETLVFKSAMPEVNL